MHVNFTTIILTHRDHKERDRLYTLFTRELGKITVRGSGARKSGAKLAPHLEPMMVSHVAIAKNRGRGTVTFALCEESFCYIRTYYRVQKLALGALSAVNHLLRDEDPHPSIYDLLVTYLHTMDALAQHHMLDDVVEQTFCVVTQGFYFHLLARLGWDVVTHACIRCDGRLPAGAWYTYLLSEGGFICQSCLRGAVVAERQKIVLSRDATAALHVFARNNIPSLAKLGISESVCKELEYFTMRRIHWVR